MTAETATAQTAGAQTEPPGSAQPESYDQTCDRLWALNAAQFSKIRTEEAARLGIDRPALDEMRKEGKRRAADKAADEAARAKADRTGNGAKSKRTDDDGYISFGPYVSSERGLYFEHEADDQGNAKAPTHQRAAEGVGKD